MKTGVNRLLMENNRVTGVELYNGQRVYSHVVISAVPPKALQPMITINDSLLGKAVASTFHLTPSPIVSLHIWLDQHLFHESFIGFWECDFHWAFQMQMIHRQLNTRHLTLVTSAADGLLSKTKAELVDLAQRQLRAITQRNVSIQRAVVLKESEATWVPPIGQVNSRPSIRTPVPNFFLAGDWVDTGLPCTIEGAVKSGHEAALIAEEYLNQQTTSLTLRLPSISLKSDGAFA